jgi:hypothetical protein
MVANVDIMRRPADLPPEFEDRSFSTREAVDAGVHLERLRRSDLERPFYGVRSRSVPTNHADRARSYAPRLAARDFLSHFSAAALWGIPLPSTIDPRVHVSRPHGARAIRTTGVIGHHLVVTPAEITEIDGIPVTTPERTWCDLAGWLRLENLVAAGDRAIWHRAPLTTFEQLVEMTNRHPGRRGRRDRLSALPLLSERADSPPESKLRTRCVLAGLPRPEANPILRGPRGEWIGQPDMAWETYREVLEYEGDGHRTDREQWLTDLARVPRFEDFRWHVNRAGRDDLRNGSRRIIGILARRLREKGWSGNLTW